MSELLQRNQWSWLRTLLMPALAGVLLAVQMGHLPAGGWANDAAVIGVLVLAIPTLFALARRNREKTNG